MKNIKISLEDGKLTLSDKGVTNASRSEVIHWKPGEGVHAVTGIEVKPYPPSTPNFWNETPVKNGVNFKGKIGEPDGAGSLSEWNYTIYTDVGSIDPKIQVKS
jgi:hypothetical protein